MCGSIVPLLGQLIFPGSKRIKGGLQRRKGKNPVNQSGHGKKERGGVVEG